MHIIKNEKGFTLIELVLIIVILGVLGAVATVQFGTLVEDANIAALDSGPSSYSTQLALSVNKLKRIPTCAEFRAAEVFDIAKPSGGKFNHTVEAACTGTLVVVTIQHATIGATCGSTWTYDGSNGGFTQTTRDITGCG